MQPFARHIHNLGDLSKPIFNVPESVLVNERVKCKIVLSRRLDGVNFKRFVNRCSNEPHHYQQTDWSMSLVY
jgi:hypothetical protein